MTVAKPLEYEQVECRNPECKVSFRKMKGSPITLCEGCLIHPNLAIPDTPVRDPRESARRRDY